MVDHELRRRFVVDLFAGCGGLSLGLEEAGFEPVLVNEINEDALETYLVNRETQFPLLRDKYSSRDVYDLTENNCERLEGIADGFINDYGFDYRRGDLDIVVGGPPCQGYSGIGHRRSFPMDRQSIPSNHLYKQMVEVIQFLNPKLFLFENVRGIFFGRWQPGGKKGEIWEDVKSAFEDIPGYRIESKLVRASEFGVPQNRPRVLIVGIRSDIDQVVANRITGLIPTSGATPPDLIELLSDLEDPDYENGGETIRYATPPTSDVQKKLRDIPTELVGANQYSTLSEHVYSKHSETVIARFKWLQRGGDPNHPDHRTKKFSQRVIPSRWDSRGPTITATSLPDDYVHYSQPRTLTVREWARLQMFPDWYRFTGNRTTGGLRRAGNPLAGEFSREVPKYTQIGNAVPVEMARVIGEHFRTILDLVDCSEYRAPKDQ